jgi:hypothetical protein
MLVYAVPRISKGQYHIEHGLACIEGLVRFWRSDMNGVVVPESYFRGIGCIREWGIMYEETILLYEYCSADQFSRGRKVENKVVNYNQYLHAIEEKFGKSGIVVFVIDARREKVEKWVARVQLYSLRRCALQLALRIILTWPVTYLPTGHEVELWKSLLLSRLNLQLLAECVRTGRAIFAWVISI